MAGAYYTGTAQVASRQVAAGQFAPIFTVPYAQVTVCVTSSDPMTCDSPASLYADINLTTPLAQPIIADAEGNFAFYAATGQYLAEFTAAGVDYKFPLVIVGQGPSGPEGPPGTTTLDSSNGAFNAEGGVQVIPTAPYFADNSALNTAILASQRQIRTLYGYAWNLGSQSFTTFGGWRSVANSACDIVSGMRGIAQGNGVTVYKYGVGDLGVFYGYGYAYPGSIVGGDEGIVGIATQLIEWGNRFTASVGSTTGTGDRSPVFANVTNTQPPVDGGWFINLTKVAASGTMTAYSTNFESYVAKIPISTADGLPLCTAWGTFTNQLAVAKAPSANSQSATVTVTLRTIGGVVQPFTQGVARLLGSQSPEMVQITSVGTPSGTQQSITFQYRLPHVDGGYLFQGGLAGTVMSFDANAAITGIAAHMVGGSIDGANLLFTIYLAGAARGGDQIPMFGRETSNITTRSGVHFYPAAENTVTLTDPTAMPPTVTLEPNNIAWAVGDLVQSVPPVYWGGSAAAFRDFSNSPNHPDFGHSVIDVLASGYNKASGFALIQVTNGNDPTLYTPNGGMLTKPRGLRFVNSGYQNHIYFDYLPDSLAKDNDAGAFWFKNGSTSGDGAHRIFYMPHAGDVFYQADQWFTETDWAWVFGSTVRAKNLSALRIAVDTDANIVGNIYGASVILPSPDGSKFKITVGNDGTITATRQ